MYEDATMNVKLNGRESKAFSVKVRDASGVVPIRLVFTLVLEAYGIQGSLGTYGLTQKLFKKKIALCG